MPHHSIVNHGFNILSFCFGQMKVMKIYDLKRENIDKILFLSPMLLIIFLFVGCIIFPSIFYDNFIWKYFWGPIVSDSTNQVMIFNGVEAADKFTWISEIVYGLMVMMAIYLCYRLIKKWKISINWNFFVGLLPYITFGVIARVFEDSGFFTEPLVYWFVTPLIYIQILILVLLFIIIGHYLQKYFKSKYIKVPTVLFLSGFTILIPYLFFTAKWFIGDRWGETQGVRFDIFILVFLLVFIITFLVYLVSKFYKKNEKISVFSKKINLAMIAGHMIDGISSYVSIYDPLKMGLPIYSEKHPASDILMQIWPPLFPIVKFLLVIFIIYILDILYKEELKPYKNVVYILKIVIFILGFAPGLRDLLRVMMGV